MIPIYSDFFSNFIAILCPIFIPKNVKDILVKAKIRQAVIIVFEVRDKAIPTEKLSILTVNAKIIIDKKLVIDPFFSSFLEINISIAKIKKIIPTK